MWTKWLQPLETLNGKNYERNFWTWITGELLQIRLANSSKFNNGTLSVAFNVPYLKLEQCKSTTLQFVTHCEQVSVIFRLANPQSTTKGSQQ